MSKELQIRNSTVDFLVFTRDAGENGIEVRVRLTITQDETRTPVDMLGFTFTSGWTATNTVAALS